MSVCGYHSLVFFVFGICFQNNFSKSSTEYIMRFYMICQNWSKLCRYFSPPIFIYIEKSNEITLLWFILKNSYILLIFTQTNYILFIESADVATTVMAVVICIQTFISWDAHRFLSLHAFTHHLIIDCNWINQMATAKFTFVTYSRWQNSKCPHTVIFVETLIFAIKLVLKAGLLPIIKMFAE